MSDTPLAPGLLAAVFRGVVLHPVAVSMVFIAALVFGAVSYQRLPVELMPDITYPTITVRTAFEGAAPQEIESQVSRPIEGQVATLDGLVNLESRSRAGQSDVVLGFDWGTPMPQASQAIREKLQTVFLPDGADRPLILRYDPSLEPFLRVALSLDPDKAAESDETVLYSLREIAEDEIQRELESLPGVAAVRIRGGLEREIRVAVREELLVARRLTVDDVRTALASNNVNLAGGSILEGDTEYLVRTLNEVRTVEEISDLKIQRSDGVAVPITDVATLTETHVEREVVSHLDGAEAVEIEVFKEADANIVDVAARVKDRLMRPGTPMLPKTHPMYQAPGVAGALPDGFVLELLDDQAAFIESAISNLLGTALTGAFFAVAVLFLFLRNFRATAIIGLAIPVSVVIGFAPLFLLDVTLNLMSLGGLALGIGMLVDNAVVVLESVQRYLDEGLDRVEAAVRGTADVASAVTASTLTTVAVFFPITFVEGVAGELFGDLSVAVVASLLASLAVALFLVPTLAALKIDLFTADDLPGVLGAVLKAREGGASWSAVPRVLLHDVTDGARETLGHWASGVGLTGLATRLGAEPRDPRAVRWLLLPWALFKASAMLLWGLISTSLTLSLAVVLLIGRLLSTIVQATVGRLLLWVAGGFGQVYARVETRFSTVLPGALRRPGLIVGGAVLALLISLGLGTTLGTELIPEVHQGRFVIEAALPVGTPLPTTVLALEPVERIVRAHPDVRSVYATIGSDGSADSDADEGAHTAVLRVELRDVKGLGEDVESLEDRVMEELRQDLQAMPRMTTSFRRPSLFSFETPVEVIVFGHDLDDLKTAGDRTVAALDGVPGLRDVSTSLTRGFPEVQIRYDRERLRRLNLDPSTVAGRVRDKIQGTRATSVQRTEQRIDVRVQLAEDERGTVDDLRALNVNPQLVPPIPLDTVAQITEADGPSEIRRVDQQRAVVVTASVAGFDLGTAGQDISAALGDVRWPDGTDAIVAGQSKEMEQSLSSLQFALLLAVFLVYVIMASTFEDLVQPFVILLSVPLAVVGVAVTLWVLGLAISVIVLIGGIVLAGVVVNNAIVFVDTINRLREDGLDRFTAIREAGRLRLRPILITTFTTVLGLLPLSLGFGEGAEIQQPLAITVIGGLVSSTLLTLVVIPVFYQLLTRAAPRTPPTPIPVGAQEPA